MRNFIRFDLVNFMPAVFMVVMEAVSGCASRTEAVANIGSSGKNIICFGDSLTRGYGASDNEDYPFLLSEAFDVPVINAGVNGDTTYKALQRLERDVLDKDPLLVIVELGGNDMLKRIPSQETFKNLALIVERIEEKGAMVVLLGIEAMFPFSSSEYKKGFRVLSKQYDTALIPNIVSGILSDPRYKSDSIHPNKEGYEIIYRRVHEVVEPLIKKNASLRGVSQKYQ